MVFCLFCFCGKEIALTPFNATRLHQYALSAELCPCFLKYIFCSVIHSESLGAPCPYAALGGELLQCVRARKCAFE